MQPTAQAVGSAPGGRTSQSGTDAEQLVKNAALRLLDRDARFRASARKGVEQADRGDFVDEREMEARIDRMLQS
jgi:predicted transcriptional regulator